MAARRIQATCISCRYSLRRSARGKGLRHQAGTQPGVLFASGLYPLRCLEWPFGSRARRAAATVL